MPDLTRHLSAVTAEGLRDVTLLTGDTEAKGHGFYIDDKSIDGAMRALLGKSTASYLGHDGLSSERLGQEIGFFSGIYREGGKLKARSFEFLESVKRTSGAMVDKLLEMAAKFPETFGLSPVIRFSPVWVMADGSEIPAELGEPPPAGAIRPLPSARISAVPSVDFVKNPAANPNGLLSVPATPAAPAPSVDAAPQPQTAPMSTDLSAALAAKTDELAKAHTAALAAKDEQHTAALSALRAELSAAHDAALSAVVKNHDAALSQLKADHAAALAAKDAAHTAVTDALKAEHKTALAAVEAKLATAESLSAAKLGVPPLVLAHASAALANLPAAGASDAAKWAQYAELKEKDPAKAEVFFRAHLRPSAS